MLALIGQMVRETRRDLATARAISQDGRVIDHDTLVALDVSFASQARMVLNRLRDKFDSIFGSEALSMSKNLVDETSDASARQLEGSLKDVAEGLTLSRDILRGTPLEEVTRAAVNENVTLIKSIPQNYFDRISGSVMRSITTGQGQAELAKEIEAIGHSTRKRAELIARDQTSKAFTAINRERMNAAGIKKFRWLHSGGGKEPRPYHRDVLNGQEFSIDNPPVIDLRTGEKGLPGQLINCRCTMIPVISFLD